MLYYGNHISLGRRDAIIQAVNGEVRSFGWYLAGRSAARLKESILKGVAWSTANPTLNLPTRRRSIAAAPSRTAAAT
jgi:hypothetical protein